MGKIMCLVCRVGHPPAVEELEDELAVWQKLVGGTIDIVGLGDGVELICNDEGLDVLPFNRIVPGRAAFIPEGFQIISSPDEDAAAPGELGYHRIFGDFALVRADNSTGELASLTNWDVAKYRTMFRIMDEKK